MIRALELFLQILIATGFMIGFASMACWSLTDAAVC